uniref:Uncharacterized protein n=1 Tax=Anguilla anguilla TaxID=7936 RepID=A0A0E9TPJ6_ANGAN
MTANFMSGVSRSFMLNNKKLKDKSTRKFNTSACEHVFL